MVFLFHERTVGKDLPDSDLPQLSSHHFEITDERLAPGAVPRTVGASRTDDQPRAA